jgi:hypothetical protein
MIDKICDWGTARLVRLDFFTPGMVVDYVDIRTMGGGEQLSLTDEYLLRPKIMCGIQGSDCYHPGHVLGYGSQFTPILLTFRRFHYDIMTTPPQAATSPILPPPSSTMLHNIASSAQHAHVPVLISGLTSSMPSCQ